MCFAFHLVRWIFGWANSDRMRGLAFPNFISHRMRGHDIPNVVPHSTERVRWLTLPPLLSSLTVCEGMLFQILSLTVCEGMIFQTLCFIPLSGCVGSTSWVEHATPLVISLGLHMGTLAYPPFFKVAVLSSVFNASRCKRRLRLGSTVA